MGTRLARLGLVALLAIACTGTADSTADQGGTQRPDPPRGVGPPVAAANISGGPGAPTIVPLTRTGDVPDADVPLPPADMAALDGVFTDVVFLARGDFTLFTSDSDIRVLWALVDLLRFHQGSARDFEVQAAIGRVGGLPDDLDWVAASNALIAADLPAFPGYLDLKRRQYLHFEPGWEPFLVADSDVDLRHVTWGGVLRDGISALNDPAVVPAERGWIGEDEEVFGVVVNGEARAYPRRMLEVHEMVNDTVGGVQIALPYCTLCGTAAGYVTDGVGRGMNAGEFRTSGLLQRSNKLMYEVSTETLYDQFGGVGLSGPLRGEELERIAVTATGWGAWRTAHPDTTIVAMDATDRRYPADFLGGRDDSGPIFPVGTVDDRLPVQERVIGAFAPGNVAVAFPEAAALAELADGGGVTEAGLSLVLTEGVPVVVDAGGAAVPSQVAFWFAWSQFEPDTRLWSP